MLVLLILFLNKLFIKYKYSVGYFFSLKNKTFYVIMIEIVDF